MFLLEISGSRGGEYGARQLEREVAMFRTNLLCSGQSLFSFDDVEYLKAIEKSRDSSVDMATVLRAGQSGFNSWQEKEIFSFHSVHPCSRTHPISTGIPRGKTVGP
jgi:hypothetical protein